MIYPTIIPGLYRIPLPTPLPVGDVNTYLAEGRVLTLIDCGINTDEAYTALEKALAEYGYKVSDIQRLLITHHHTDHVGLAQRIVAESGAEVWCHPDTVAWLEQSAQTRQTLNRFATDLFREGGVPQPALDTIVMVNDYLVSLSSEAKVSRTLNEGDQVELCGCQWQVYHTPGHAGDLICLYQAETQVLLSSDHLIKKISSNPLIEAPTHPGDPRPQRLLDYMREMERIAQLDIKVAYAGHGEEFSGIQEMVKGRLRFHVQRADKILALFEGQPRNLYELSQLMFPRLHDSQLYLAFSEVLGHIDLLERDGRLSRRTENNLLYWLPKH